MFADRPSREWSLDMLDHVKWPYESDPRRSHIYAMNEIEVDAPPQVVWDILIDAENWSNFYPGAEELKIVTGEPMLALGAKYHFKTAGLPLENTVKEFVPASRLAWDSVPHPGPDGPTAYHGWVITETDSGCHLLTEETQQGEWWLELARKYPGVLYQFHQQWVEGLAHTAETAAAKAMA